MSFRTGTLFFPILVLALVLALSDNLVLVNLVPLQSYLITKLTTVQVISADKPTKLSKYDKFSYE